MRATFLFLWLAISASCYSQNYVLDPTFGGTGVVVKNLSFYPEDIKLYNNNYYFISANGSIIKILYDGDTDTSFGTDGLVSLSSIHTFTGFNIIDGFIYAYGTTNTDTQVERDAFVAKIDAVSGVFESTFGVNGIKYIDFGVNETLNDLLVEDDGALYCIGTRAEMNNSESSLIYFKLNSDGSLNNSFDNTGYKQVLLTQKSYGIAIKPYNGNYLLIGRDYHFDSSTYNPMILALVDIQGNLVSSFGEDGTKSVSLYDGMSITIAKPEINGDQLYIDYYYFYSPYTQGGKTLKYNLGTDEVIYNNSTLFSYANSKAEGDKRYTVGYQRCGNPGASECERNFILKRFLADGTADTSFMGTGAYTYNFPPEYPMSDDQSRVFEIAQDGTILIGGIHSGYPINFKFAMLRLIDTPLSTGNINGQSYTITPNPFKDHITVKANQAPNSAEVYDLTGRLVANPTVNYNNGSTELKLDNITQCGIYLLKLDFGNKTETHKIIKQ